MAKKPSDPTTGEDQNVVSGSNYTDGDTAITNDFDDHDPTPDDDADSDEINEDFDQEDIPDVDADEDAPTPGNGLMVRRGGRTNEQSTGLVRQNVNLAIVTEATPFGAGSSPKEPRGGSLPNEPKLVSRVYNVTKASVKDNTLSCSYEEILTYEGMAPVKRIYTMGGGLPPHPDLKRCFEKLAPFLAHVNEQVDVSPYELGVGEVLPDRWRNFTVTTVSITTGTGIVLSGSRKLRGNRKLTLNTPFVDFDGDKESWYRHARTVEAIVMELQGEVALALEGKAYNPQLNMFDQQEEAA